MNGRFFFSLQICCCFVVAVVGHKNNKHTYPKEKESRSRRRPAFFSSLNNKKKRKKRRAKFETTSLTTSIIKLHVFLTRFTQQTNDHILSRRDDWLTQIFQQMRGSLNITIIFKLSWWINSAATQPRLWSREPVRGKGAPQKRKANRFVLFSVRVSRAQQLSSNYYFLFPFPFKKFLLAPLKTLGSPPKHPILYAPGGRPWRTGQ